MKLLVVTRKVDVQDERIGFFVDWLIKLAQRVDELKIICLEKGDTSGLPENVELFSMGKELGYSKLRKFFRYRKLLKQLLPEVDGVFVHMIPLYANLAGSLVKKHNKKMYLWYTHKTVDRALRQTQKWVTGYLTAAPQSFQMPTEKPVQVMNHGININKFPVNNRLKHEQELLKLLTVGRIAPVKDLETLIDTAKLLKARDIMFNWDIIGAPSLPRDEDYLTRLKQSVEQNDLEANIKFLGPLPHKQVIEHYAQVDMFVNFSDAAFDKTMLEAMAAGTLVFTPNEAFRQTLGEYADVLMFRLKDPEDLIKHIMAVNNQSPERKQKLGQGLRDRIINMHNLDNLADKIVLLYK